MSFLLAEVSVASFMPFFFFAAVAFVIFVVVLANAAKNKGNGASDRGERHESQSGLTPHQREYIESLRKKKTEQSQKKPDPESTHTHHGDVVVANSDGHVHIGTIEERYDTSGSLGEVNDEGCADLNGVRLIINDIAYSGVEQKRDYTDIAKAMVLGEVLDKPRCRKPYGRK